MSNIDDIVSYFLQRNKNYNAERNSIFSSCKRTKGWKIDYEKTQTMNILFYYFFNKNH